MTRINMTCGPVGGSLRFSDYKAITYIPRLKRRTQISRAADQFAHEDLDSFLARMLDVAGNRPGRHLTNDLLSMWVAY